MPRFLQITTAEARLILREVDKNGDEKVDFDEFLAAMTANGAAERVLQNRKAQHPNSVDS